MSGKKALDLLSCLLLRWIRRVTSLLRLMGTMQHASPLSAGPSREREPLTRLLDAGSSYPGQA